MQAVRATNPRRMSYYDYGSDCSRMPAAAATGATNATHPTTPTTTSQPSTPSPAPTTRGEHLYDDGTTPYWSYTCNRHAYGDGFADQPPEYDLSHIPPATPIALFSGGADSLAGPADVSDLAAALAAGGSLALHHVEPAYGHLDPGEGVRRCGGARCGGMRAGGSGKGVSDGMGWGPHRAAGLCPTRTMPLPPAAPPACPCAGVGADAADRLYPHVLAFLDSAWRGQQQQQQQEEEEGQQEEEEGQRLGGQEQ